MPELMEIFFLFTKTHFCAVRLEHFFIFPLDFISLDGPKLVEGHSAWHNGGFPGTALSSLFLLNKYYILLNKYYNFSCNEQNNKHINKEFSEKHNEQQLALLGKALHNLVPKLQVALLLLALPSQGQQWFYHSFIQLHL